MATFHYKAYTAQGVVTAGTIVADGVEAAIDGLYGSGLTPFETYRSAGEPSGRSGSPPQAAGKTDVPFWKQEIFESNRFSLKELAAFTVELASLTNSGQPLDAAFRIIAGPGAAAKTVRLANGLLKDVLSGMQLSEAMAQRPDIFPSDYRAILSAGEAGGVTGQVLKQISELLARRLEIRSKVTAALVYPVILILMSMVSVMVIVFVLVPSIAPIFTDAGLPLPGILNTLAEMQDNWLAVTLTLGVGGMAAAWIWSRVRRNADMMLGDRPAEIFVAGGRQVDPASRSRRLRPRARHAAQCKGSADVGDADLPGIGDQQASECSLWTSDRTRPGGHAPAPRICRSRSVAANLSAPRRRRRGIRSVGPDAGSGSRSAGG